MTRRFHNNNNKTQRRIMVPVPAKKKRKKNNKQRQGSGDYDASPRQACRFIATNGDGYRADTNIQIHKYTNTNRRL